jgi:hypothetical protein
MSKSLKLQRVVDYSEERIDVDKVSLENFITVDNMLPNKCGITLADNMPPQGGSLPRYKKDNILVGNIRPYLKKIWFADRDGGAAADVLIFDVKAEYYPKFVFYAMFRDDFFAHMMRGKKGTKMPRGDLIPAAEYPTQQKIAAVLSALDYKIELNNRINAELEAMAKTLYDYWFVQFDFTDKNNKPYKSSGGKMDWNPELKREIPERWKVCNLGDFEINIITGKTPPKTKPAYFNGEIPFITIGDIRGNMHVVETEETLTKLGADYQSNKYINKGAICVTCIASPGLVGFASELSQTNQQINSIECGKDENRYYLYFAIKDFFVASKAKTGNTFANMNKGDFASIRIIHPADDTIIKFMSTVKSSFELILNNSLENRTLSSIRDWLIPMLMNGQVKVA